jgi:hypothetical protein
MYVCHPIISDHEAFIGRSTTHFHGILENACVGFSHSAMLAVDHVEEDSHSTSLHSFCATLHFDKPVGDDVHLRSWICSNPTFRARLPGYAAAWDTYLHKIIRKTSDELVPRLCLPRSANARFRIACITQAFPCLFYHHDTRTIHDHCDDGI